MKRVHWWPWIGWCYSMNRAVAFLRSTGYSLRFWGVVIPTGRHTGITIGVMRRLPHPEETEEPTDD